MVIVFDYADSFVVRNFRAKPIKQLFPDAVVADFSNYSAEERKLLLTADRLIICNKATPELVEIVLERRKANLKTFYDLTLNVFEDPSWSLAQRKLAMCLLKLCKKILVPTFKLGLFYSQFNKPYSVFPLLFSKKLLSERNTQDNEKVTIVWDATESNDSVADYKVVKKPLATILNKYENVEVVIYNSNITPKHERIKVGVLPIELSERIDILKQHTIGIAPLSLSDYKLGLAYLEYSLVGLPTVCSVVEPYFAVSPGYSGYFAKSANSWVKYLSALIEKEKLRAKLGGNAKQSCAKYLVEKNEKIVRIIFEVE